MDSVWTHLAIVLGAVLVLICMSTLLSPSRDDPRVDLARKLLGKASGELVHAQSATRDAAWTHATSALHFTEAARMLYNNDDAALERATGTELRPLLEQARATAVKAAPVPHSVAVRATRP